MPINLSTGSYRLLRIWQFVLCPISDKGEHAMISLSKGFAPGGF